MHDGQSNIAASRVAREPSQSDRCGSQDYFKWRMLLFEYGICCIQTNLKSLNQLFEGSIFVFKEALP